MGLSREKINYMILRYYDIMTPDITYHEIIKIKEKVEKQGDYFEWKLNFPNPN